METSRPRCPALRGLRQDHGDRGHKGPSGQGRGRGKALALPRRAPLSPSSSSTLSRCAPGRWPSVRLRGSHAATRRMLLAAAARLLLPLRPRSHTASSAAAGAPVRGQLQSARPLRVRRCGEEAPGPPSPHAGEGRPRGAGRRPRSLGFAPRRAGRTGAAASQPAHLRPPRGRRHSAPVSTGAASASGPACTETSSGKREKRRPSQPTEGTALLHCLLEFINIKRQI